MGKLDDAIAASERALALVERTAVNDDDRECADTIRSIKRTLEETRDEFRELGVGTDRT